MQPEKLIRVLIVEDHPVFSDGLTFIINSQTDMTVAGQSRTAEQGIDQFHSLLPDITLMDQRLPGKSGLHALSTIRAKSPHAKIIMLTTSDGDAEIQAALRAGAAAYLLKSTAKSEILSTIRNVYLGKRHIPSDVASRLAEHMGAEELTNRELEVLRFIRDGYRNKQIADVLSVSEATVNFHVKNLLAKLQANDRTHAVTIALRRGMIEMSSDPA